MEWSRDAIIEKGYQELRRRGYRADNWICQYDLDNIKFKKHHEQSRQKYFYEVLEDRDYQALWFSRKEIFDPNYIVLGSQLWIFLDQYTGEIIWVQLMP